MKSSEPKREYWASDTHPPYVQSYAGVVDFANGHDLRSSFESHLKFQALFFEKIIVPDSFFYTPAPIVESVRRLRQAGLREDEHISLQLLKSGVLVPSLRQGDSLLDNWIRAKDGLRPGELGYLGMEEGKRILEVIEPHVTSFTRWPLAMAQARKPPYAALLQQLFVRGVDGNALIGRNELTFLLRLKNHRATGWHRLLDRFQTAIESQLEGQNFRRGGLEQAVVDHFTLPRFNQVYEFLSSETKIKNHNQRAELAVAKCLLEITATIYEAYQARQFNSVGNLFPNCFRPVVNAELYSKIVELSAGRPHNGGEIVPRLCINLRKMSLKKILEFRTSLLFKDQYCQMLRHLKSGDGEHSFVEINGDFYRFLETSYLPAILKQFDPAINPDALKQWGSRVKAVSWIAAASAGFATVAGGAPIQTLWTQIGVLGASLFATVAMAGQAIESGGENVARLVTHPRDMWLRHQARKHLNGFVALEQQAATKVLPTTTLRA